MVNQNQVVKPKSYVLNDLTIYPNAHDPITLKYRFLEMNIMEDLFTNSVNADLLISDANNIIQNYPITGFEKISVNFTTPGGEVYQKKFRIYKISKQQPIREREQAFILHLVSEEEIQNYKIRVSKAYVGKTISDIVDDIQKNYLQSKLYANESTKYLQHIVIPNLLPFDAIRWLTTKAISGNTNSPSYLYFENKNGYNFVTLDSLVIQPSVVTYNYQPTNLANINPSFQAIQSFSYDCMFDILEKIRNGMYGGNLQTYDILKKEYKSFPFRYNQDWYNSRNHLHPIKSKNPITGQTGPTFLQNQQQELMNPNSIQRFLPITHGQQYDSKMEQVVMERISRLEQMHWLTLNYTIPGDTSRTIGEVITFNQPSTEPLTKDSQIPNYYYSGKYLITSLRHLINQDEHVTVMTLSRESHPIPIP